MNDDDTDRKVKPKWMNCRKHRLMIDYQRLTPAQIEQLKNLELLDEWQEP